MQDKHLNNYNNAVVTMCPVSYNEIKSKKYYIKNIKNVGKILKE